MRVAYVKKIFADGSPCAKCAEVEERLRAGGYESAIDETLIADERDPDSPGMQLARRLGIERAPFFVVETPEKTKVYTVYFKFLREVLQGESHESDEAREILRDNPDLDVL